MADKMPDSVKLFDNCRRTPLPRAVYQLFLRYLNTDTSPSTDDLMLSGFVSPNWKYSSTSAKFQKTLTQAHLKFQYWARSMCIHDDDPTRLMCRDNQKMIIPEEEFPELIMKTHTCDGCPGFKHRGVGTTVLELSRTVSMGHRNFGMSENQLRIIVEQCRDPHCSSWVARQRYRAMIESKNRAKMPDEATLKSLAATVGCSPTKDSAAEPTLSDSVQMKIEPPVPASPQQDSDCTHTATLPQPPSGEPAKERTSPGTSANGNDQTTDQTCHQDQTKSMSKTHVVDLPYIDIPQIFSSHFDDSGKIHISRSSKRSEPTSGTDYVSYADRRGKVCIERWALEEVQRKKQALRKCSHGEASGKQQPAEEEKLDVVTVSDEEMEIEIMDLEDEMEDNGEFKKDKGQHDSNASHKEDDVPRIGARNSRSQVAYASAHAERKPVKGDDVLIVDTGSTRRTAVSQNELRSRVRSAQRSPARAADGVSTSVELPRMPPKKVLYTMTNSSMADRPGLNVATLNILGQKCDRNKACAIQGEYVLPPEPVSRSGSPGGWETTLPSSPSEEDSPTSGMSQDRTNLNASESNESSKKNSGDEGTNESAEEINNLKVLIGKSPSNLSSIANIPIKIRQEKSDKSGIHKKKSDSSKKAKKKDSVSTLSSSKTAESTMPLVSLQNLVSAVGDKRTTQSKAPVEIRPAASTDTINRGINTSKSMSAKIPTALALPITITPSASLSANVSLPGQMKSIFRNVMNSLQSKPMQPSTTTAGGTPSSKLPMLLTISPQGQIVSCHVQLPGSGLTSMPTSGVPALFIPSTSALVSTAAGSSTTLTTAAAMRPLPQPDCKPGERTDDAELQSSGSHLIKDIVNDEKKSAGKRGDLEKDYGTILNRIHAVGRSLQPVVTGKKMTSDKVMKRIEEAKLSIDHMREGLIERFGQPDYSVLDKERDSKKKEKSQSEEASQDKKDHKQESGKESKSANRDKKDRRHDSGKESNSRLSSKGKSESSELPRTEVVEKSEPKTALKGTGSSGQQTADPFSKPKHPEPSLKSCRVPVTSAKRTDKQKTPYYRKIPPLEEQNSKNTEKAVHPVSQSHGHGKEISQSCSNNEHFSKSVEPSANLQNTKAVCETNPTSKSTGSQKSEGPLITISLKHDKKKHKSNKKAKFSEVGEKSCDGDRLVISADTNGDKSVKTSSRSRTRESHPEASSSRPLEETGEDVRSSKKHKKHKSHKKSHRADVSETIEKTNSFTQTHHKPAPSTPGEDISRLTGNNSSEKSTPQNIAKQDDCIFCVSEEAGHMVHHSSISASDSLGLGKEKALAHAQKSNECAVSPDLLSSSLPDKNVTVRPKIGPKSFKMKMKMQGSIVAEKETTVHTTTTVISGEQSYSDKLTKVIHSSPETKGNWASQFSKQLKCFQMKLMQKSGTPLPSAIAGSDEHTDRSESKIGSNVKSCDTEPKDEYVETSASRNDDTSGGNVQLDEHHLELPLPTEQKQSLKRPRPVSPTTTASNKHDGNFSPPTKKRFPREFSCFSPPDEATRGRFARGRGYRGRGGYYQSPRFPFTRDTTSRHSSFERNGSRGHRWNRGNYSDNLHRENISGSPRSQHLRYQRYQNHTERNVQKQMRNLPDRNLQNPTERNMQNRPQRDMANHPQVDMRNRPERNLKQINPERELRNRPERSNLQRLDPDLRNRIESSSQQSDTERGWRIHHDRNLQQSDLRNLIERRSPQIHPERDLRNRLERHLQKCPVRNELCHSESSVQNQPEKTAECQTEGTLRNRPERNLEKEPERNMQNEPESGKQNRHEGNIQDHIERNLPNQPEMNTQNSSGTIPSDRNMQNRLERTYQSRSGRYHERSRRQQENSYRHRWYRDDAN